MAGRDGSKQLQFEMPRWRFDDAGTVTVLCSSESSEEVSIMTDDGLDIRPGPSDFRARKGCVVRRHPCYMLTDAQKECLDFGPVFAKVLGARLTLCLVCIVPPRP